MRKRNIRTLQRMAQSSTAYRGHRMEWTLAPAFGSARCRKCGAWVQIETTPMPNGIDISGTAVAVDCGADL